MDGRRNEYELTAGDLAEIGAARNAEKPAKPTKPPRAARREKFVMVTASQVDRLARAPGATWEVFVRLLFLSYRSRGQPFALPGGALAGIERRARRRALAELEDRGLVFVERRRGKSSRIAVISSPDPAQK